MLILWFFMIFGFCSRGMLHLSWFFKSKLSKRKAEEYGLSWWYFLDKILFVVLSLFQMFQQTFTEWLLLSWPCVKQWECKGNLLYFQCVVHGYPVLSKWLIPYLRCRGIAIKRVVGWGFWKNCEHTGNCLRESGKTPLQSLNWILKDE